MSNLSSGRLSRAGVGRVAGTNRGRLSAGFSLVEILVVIAVLAVLAGVGIMAVSGVIHASRETTARANMEYLNEAVRKYNHAVKELTNAAGDDSGVFSELQIDGSLENAAGSKDRPGSPYLAQHFSRVSTSDTTTYRARWNGYEFELIEPGASGTGLDLMKLQ